MWTRFGSSPVRGAIVACFMTVVASCVATCYSAEPIPPADFAELHSLIQPKEDESAWLSIPWGTDLWQARQKAAAAGKPILLWEMDGHPLGCT
jgi:hypothetical protein